MPRPFADKPTEVVQCWFKLHAWEEVETDPGYVPKIPGEVVWWQCSRCNKERIEIWNKATGDIIYSTYRTPAGYPVGKGAFLEYGGRRGVMSQGRLEYFGRKTGKYSQRKPRNKNGR